MEKIKNKTKLALSVFFTLILALAQVLVSSIAAKILAVAINSQTAKYFSFNFDLINFGFLQAGFMLLLSTAVTLLAALIPLKKHSLL